MTLRQLAKRCVFWQENLVDLGLLHWRIDVSIEETPEGLHNALAAVTPADFYDSATISFAARLLETDDLRVVDEAIVHELLHIAFRDLHDATHSICDNLSAGERDLFDQRTSHEAEGIIERLARSLVSCYYYT